jgi:hypothetical protein
VILSTKDIAERIKEPLLCTMDELSELNSLATDYPYTQIFSILYLQTLAKNKHDKFEEELQKHAFRITDRNRLFHLIQNAQSPADQKQEQQIVPEIIVSTDDYTEQEKSHQQEEIPVEVPIITLEEPVIETELTSLINEEVSSTETEESTREEVVDDISEENVEFNKELLAEAINQNYDLDHLEELVNDESFDEVEAENISEEIPVDESSESIVSKEQGRSFTGWLRSNENDIHLSIDPEKARIEAILDKFISEEPSITRPTKDSIQIERPKKEFYSPAQKAKESIDPNAVPVSETLAKIFAAQGNYPRAIAAYEQLMLTIPEKKTFFATQIKELKKKLNT